MNVIPLFIPYVNRPDLLNKAIESVPDSVALFVIINNSGTTCRHATFDPPVPLTFAQTQNWMLKLAREETFYLFMHSDASCEPWVIEKLIAMAEAQTEKWGVIFTAYDALAAYNTEAFNAVGGWDANLQWYGSECDMYYRLRLAGYPTLESKLPVHHEISATIKADLGIQRAVNAGAMFRQYYYQLKWGGLPGEEKFTIPFNGY